ncbi:MAG: hypothetical protein AUH28_20655 [Acidobacteria bacterium 13_1_40CM_56_16]|nr:MAG: hypothetical protein AUH28_20655 [Acidobacteria bacterium 13_1_40CM_56_16]
MVRHRKPPSQTRKTFLHNHVSQLVSIDLFTVQTIWFEVLFVFVALADDRRRVLHSNVTAHPTAAWTVSPLRCECVLACIPPAEEPNKFFAVVKLLCSSALMVAVGAVIYWVGKSNKRNA